MTPTKVQSPKNVADLVCPDCGSSRNKCVQNKPQQGSCRGLVMPGTELKNDCYCDHCGWCGYVLDLRTKPQKGFGTNFPGKYATKQFIFHRDLENKNENT
jgi:hypothetical protein